MAPFVTAPRLIAGILILAFLYFASAVFIPLVMAVLIALFLDPFVKRLERVGLPRVISTTSAMFVFLLAAVLATQVVYQVSMRAVNQAPIAYERMRSIAASIEARTGEFRSRMVPPVAIPLVEDGLRVGGGESEIQRV